MTRDYAVLGWQYAEDVVSGAIPNGRWAIKACERSLRDRARQASDSFPYTFDVAMGAKVCAFAEHLPHVKDSLSQASGDETRRKLAGTLIHLEDWQCWLLMQLFGWKHASGPRKGLRRFRHAYIEVGRGNAKSTLSSCIALYCLAADNDGGATVLSCATTRDQAAIVWGDSAAMARSPIARPMMDHLGVKVHAHSISVQKSNSSFVSLSSKATTLDGFSVSLAVIDECHAHKTRDLWDVVVTGCGKREQSLCLGITTAGTNRFGICYEQHTYLTKILDEVTESEDHFGCIWSADEGDDFRDIASWRKANPNFGISVDQSYLASEARKAEIMPAAQNNFRTKHLCQWVSSSSAWMDMDIWNRCADPSLKIEDFIGEEVFLGVDLASVSDIAAKVYLFSKLIDGEKHYFLFGKYYLSEAAVKDGRNSQYEGWQISGELTQTPGDVTDYDQIEDEIIADLKNYTVKELAFDSWQAQHMIQDLQALGVAAVEVRQGVKSLSAPMKQLERLARTGRLHHDGNHVLAWAASNVRAESDSNDNIKPTKDREENKIDPIVAAISALARAMLFENQEVFLDAHYVF